MNAMMVGAQVEEIDSTPDPASDDLSEVVSRITALRNTDDIRLSIGWKDISALPREIALLSPKLEELLIVFCPHLSDLSEATKLQRLRVLELQSADALVDLNSLSGLQQLEELNLTGCQSLTHLGALHDLPRLRRLTLSSCTSLQSLHGIERLQNLVELRLANCPNLVDLSALASLQRLEILNLNRCSGLRAMRGVPRAAEQNASNLRSLRSLGQLRSLFIAASAPLNIGPDICTDDCWPVLEWLECDHIEGAPAELGSRDGSPNCLARLVAWRNDLVAGASLNSQLKVLILGNGRVGKTQICRRLRGEAYDPVVPSTHGIQIGRFTLQVNRPLVNSERRNIELTIWDFGGQDIYLGTHALFLDSRAIYLLAWNPEFEFGEQAFDEEVSFRNRPLPFWLEYVHSLAGKQAPVLAVQTRCDQESEVEATVPGDVQLNFGWYRNTYCSAAMPDGMERLTIELKAAAKAQLARYGDVVLPSSWVAVAETLRRNCEILRHKTITLEEFGELCRSQGGVSDPEALLGFLHQSGQVFWREGIFGSQVVLAQQWALEGVYAVLDRDHVWPIIRQQHGRFTAQLLNATVWKTRSDRERALFLSMMEQCQLCFPLGLRSNDYIAPGQLPPEMSMMADIQRMWGDAAPAASARLSYGFLHEGVLRAVLCQIGKRAGPAAVYWAYGACFFDRATEAVLRIRSELPNRGGGGWITVESVGRHPHALARVIVDLILRCNIGNEPEIEWIARHNDAPLEPAFGEVPLRLTPLPPAQQPVSGGRKRIEGFADLHIVQPPRRDDELPTVYVSYAWGESGGLLADRLEAGLADRGISLVRDQNAVRKGDWISRFIAELGRAQHAVVLLSDKYLRSPYCMRELLYLFQTSSSDLNLLDDRVIPVLDGNLTIGRAYERATYIAYWADEARKLNDAYRDLPIVSLSDADRQEWLAILDFCHRVSDMMAWVADKLMPRSEAGVDAAVEMVAQRLA